MDPFQAFLGAVQGTVDRTAGAAAGAGSRFASIARMRLSTAQVEALAVALRSQTAVTGIRIEGEQAGWAPQWPNGISWLPWLTHTHPCHHPTCAGCSITDELALPIAGALTTNTSIETLELRGNPHTQLVQRPRWHGHHCCLVLAGQCSLNSPACMEGDRRHGPPLLPRTHTSWHLAGGLGFLCLQTTSSPPLARVR